MQKEGQIRIPSGCAISGIFSKNGKLINGEAIRQSIAVMHDRSNGLEAVLPDMAFIRNIKNYMRFMFFMTTIRQKKNARHFWSTILIL